VQINRSHRTLLATTLLGLALSGAATVCQAQSTDFIIDTFDSDTSAAWTRWWGAASQSYEFDPSVDAQGNSNSGSLKATIGYDIASNAGDNQFAVQNYFATSDGTKVTLDGTQYTNLVFDVRFDPSSPTRPVTGDFGYWEFGLIPSDSSQTWLGALSATNGNWIHVAVPLDPTVPKMNAIQGVVFKMWAGDTSVGGNNQLTGTTIFWVDNIKLIDNTNTAAPPPPTLSITKATPGLQLFASKSGSQYQRQNIYTLNNTGYSWVDNPNPTTYSLTIKDYPNGSHSGFQTQIFLTPGAALPTWETSPDWNEPNIVFLDIQNNADGTANATFRYKVDQANGNSMLYNANPANGPVGALASIGNPTPLGKWSVTFSNATSVTLTTPSGTSTNFTMPSQAATLFADPLYAYFGVQPNALNNIGQSATFGRVQITGVSAPLDDNFAGVRQDPSSPPILDPATWQVSAEDPVGIVLVPPDSICGLDWTLPASGFALRASSSLAPGSWVDSGLTNIVQIGNRMRVVVPTSSPSLPATNHLYFQLVK
jgi:hypothetical protein